MSGFLPRSNIKFPNEGEKKKGPKKGPSKKMFQGEKCSVCEDPATGFNYRVVSCNACKAFFRRAVLAGKTFECRFSTMSDPVDCMSNPQWLKICQHCRLLKCRQVGMRDEYVHNLRIQRINKNVSNDELSFTDTLDPGQTVLVNIFTVFWGMYIGNIGSTVNSDCEFAAKLKKDISKIDYPDFPSLEGSDDCIRKLSQTQYLSSVIRVHIKMVQSLFGQIPEFKAMSEVAKRTLIRIGCCQMAMLRGSYRYQVLKFEAYQRRRQNEEMEEESSVDDLAQSTQHLAMTEQTLGMDKLKSIGLSEGLLKRIKNLSLNGSINRVESYEEPDFIEWSLLSGLSLLNNEAMFAQNVLPIERSTVERLQESLLIILRMKIKKDGKPLGLLARYMAFLSELRAYSDESIKEWGQYFHYQPKICLAPATPHARTQSAPTATV